MTWNELFFDFVTLWVTIDPLGTVPLYLSVTKHLPAAERKRAAVRATVISFFLLAAFLYFGQILLNVMRIELLSFQIAGGIILFLFALSMIFAKENPNDAPPDKGHDVVVLTDNNTHSLLEQTLTCGVLVLVLVATLFLMLLGDRILALIGRSGAN